MENCINFYWEQNQKKREVSILDLGRENVGDPKLLLGAGWQAARQSTLGTGSFKYSHSLSSHRKVKLGGLFTSGYLEAFYSQWYIGRVYLRLKSKTAFKNW